MQNKRPIEERVKPQDVKFIINANENYEDGVVISSEIDVYNMIEKNSNEGFLTSARMLRDKLGVGHTTIAEKLRELLKKQLIIREFAVAKTGSSKTILPFYVTIDHTELLKNKTSIKAKKRS